MIMMNVIVVEDKHPILRSIVRKIENYHSELRIIGEATDGLSALEMILRLKPSIVITDIRMPGMDGLQLITQVKAELPDTIFVILTGYNEFDYARQALKLGVTEYLLKPITQEAMNDMLENVSKLASTTRQAKEIALLSHLLRVGTASTSPLNLDVLCYDNYYIMTLCAGSFSKFSIDMTNPFHNFWIQRDLVSFLYPHLSKHEVFWVLDGQFMNELIIVFGCSQGSTLDLQHISELTLTKFRPKDIPISIAISNKVTKLHDLKVEFQLTKSKLEKRALFGISSYFYVQDIALVDEAQIPDFDEQKLLSLIKNKKRDAFMNEMKATLAKWEKLQFTQLQLESCLLQIVHMGHKATIQRSQSMNNLELELHEILSISKDYSALRSNLNFLFEKFFVDQESVNRSNNSTKTILDTVEQYFKNHLADEISIQDVADQVNLNVSYLSREFKKHKGISPIEYLTQLRIEKAKQLLLDPSQFMFKDIALLVGYQNQYYFSKVFKLITGLSPTQYKTIHEKKLT